MHPLKFQLRSWSLLLSKHNFRALLAWVAAGWMVFVSLIPGGILFAFLDCRNTASWMSRSIALNWAIMPIPVVFARCLWLKAANWKSPPVRASFKPKIASFGIEFTLLGVHRANSISFVWMLKPDDAIPWGKQLLRISKQWGTCLSLSWL